MIKTALITISSSRTVQNDKSGQILKEVLPDNEYDIREYFVIKDDIDEIKQKLIFCSDELALDLVLTSGGTGLGPYDVTPEATLAVASKNVPGISELIRAKGIKHNQRSSLSRAVSVVRGKTLMINLPGSPKGASESLEIILPLLQHAIDMIAGGGH